MEPYDPSYDKEVEINLLRRKVWLQKLALDKLRKKYFYAVKMAGDSVAVTKRALEIISSYENIIENLKSIKKFDEHVLQPLKSRLNDQQKEKENETIHSSQVR